MSMENFDEIKNIWQQGSSQKDLLSYTEIMDKIEGARKKMLFKNLSGIVALILPLAVACWSGLNYEFAYSTTYVGILFVIAAILLGIFFSSQLLLLVLKKIDPTTSNSEYLQQMIRYRNRQRFFQSKGISLYFILLTIGIVLYMAEFAARDLSFGLLYYTITLGWFAIAWFYLRKRTIRKQEKQINEQVERLENIADRLNK
jgi:hypothetical protein